MESEAKARAIARISERMERESVTLPYRWGCFQGALLIPYSLLILWMILVQRNMPQHEPWYLTFLALLMALTGLPLGVGLLMKKRFALDLVYVMFGPALLLVALKLPIAIKHYLDPGDKGSAMAEAEFLLVWLLSLHYYRRRKLQFH